MTPDERIGALEREIEALKNNFREYASIHQHLIGESQAYQAAVTALIAAHPDPHGLLQLLVEHASRPEADAVFQANNEERLQGLQDGQAYLLEVCDIACKLHRKPE